jgi:hypothetical protein
LETEYYWVVVGISKIQTDAQTEIVQNKLEELLKEVILPNQNLKFHRWSGIMGIGNSKNPIVSQLSENVYCML